MSTLTQADLDALLVLEEFVYKNGGAAHLAAFETLKLNLEDARTKIDRLENALYQIQFEKRDE